jgi:hypothetical protein
MGQKITITMSDMSMIQQVYTEDKTKITIKNKGHYLAMNVVYDNFIVSLMVDNKSCITDWTKFNINYESILLPCTDFTHSDLLRTEELNKSQIQIGELEETIRQKNELIGNLRTIIRKKKQSLRFGWVILLKMMMILLKQIKFENLIFKS